MFVCLIIMAFSICLYVLALFIMKHKYKIRYLAYDKEDARKSDSMRIKCHFKKWQVLLGLIFMFIPVLNILIGIIYLILAVPRKEEREFIWSDNERAQRTLTWLTEDF